MNCVHQYAEAQNSKFPVMNCRGILLDAQWKMQGVNGIAAELARL
jgi:hypothetical protein